MGGASLDDEAFTLHVTSHSVCAAIFIFMGLCSLSRIMEPLRTLQTAPLSSRLQWCSSANVYICSMSAILNLFHITDFESSVQELLGGTSAGVVKPIEYMLTCPFMMLTLVVLAGDTVPVSRQLEVTTLTTVVLLAGFFASLMKPIAVKMMLFGTGVLAFIALGGIVEKNVRDHSQGKESLFQMTHGSPYKAICVKVVSTWFLFPVWWLLSAEGLNIVESPQINTLVSSVLNILAKGVYVIFLERIRDKYIGEDSLMVHPTERTHQIQSALCMAARLGPAKAIQVLVQNIEQSEKQMNHIRELMSTDELKVAASYLAQDDKELADFGRLSFRTSSREGTAEQADLQLQRSPRDGYPSSSEIEARDKFTQYVPTVLGAGSGRGRRPSQLSGERQDAPNLHL